MKRLITFSAPSIPVIATGIRITSRTFAIPVRVDVRF